MAFEFVPGYHVRLDQDTGLLWACSGSAEDWQTVAPIMQAALIQDAQGNSADVSADGALKAGDWADQPPLMGTDATGADTYVSVLVTPRVCRHMAVAVATHPVIISLDGGKTDHIPVAAGNTVISGLNIPAAVTIQAKNQNAGSNYTSLAISVW